MIAPNRRLRTAIFGLALLWAASPANAAQLAQQRGGNWVADSDTCDDVDWRSALIDEDEPIAAPCLPDHAGFAPNPAEDGAPQLRR